MKPKAYIYSHIPKTGGTSLEHQLSNQLKYGTEFYHFYPRSRWNHPETLQFEVNLKSLQEQDILLFGHNVNEGTIKLLPNHEVQLYTALRNPLKRLLSHFDMVKSVGNFTEASNVFIKRRGNFMCKWLVEKFPSFSKDIYQPIYLQAAETLSHFEEVFIAEKSAVDYNKFMKAMKCSYDHELRTNVKFYTKQEYVWDENENLETYYKEDTKLYDHVTNGFNQKRVPFTEVKYF